MATSVTRSVVAIDPGNAKCGLVLVEAGDHTRIVRSVVPTETLIVSLSQLIRQNPPVETILIGSGTGSHVLAKAIRTALPSAELLVVDEKGTTLLARQRYFKDHPPRGWKKLIPIGMLIPDEPYDDYAALLLAERYLATIPTT